MQVRVGDTVKLRDGRIVSVSDAAEVDPDAYTLYDWDTYMARGVFKVNASMPPETIFRGYLIDGSNKVVVSDMSEVVSILD